MKIQSAKFTLPKMTTKRVFIGAYGGHYDAVVIFGEKPRPSADTHNIIKREWYDCLDNKESIIGCVELCEFERLFPGIDLAPILHRGRPREIEVTDIMEARLTACFDDYGKMSSFYFDLDGWCR